MAHVYDLRPGELVETDEPLSVDELDEARAALERGAPLERVAKRLGGRVPPPPEPRRRFAVDVERLLELDDERLDRLVGVENARALLEEGAPV